MTKQPVYVDIKQEMQDWQNARFGRQVRSANVNALTKLQDQSNSAVDYIIEKGHKIDQTRQDANTILQSASDAVDHANSVTAEYKQYADTKLSQTEAQRQLAENAKQGADDAATLAESWAEGGTGTRPGENTNSSKYYCDQSGTYAQNAKNDADRAAQYSRIVAPSFYFDPETSAAYIKTGTGVDFIVVESRIYWKITA